MTHQRSRGGEGPRHLAGALDGGSGLEAEALAALVDALDADVVTLNEVDPARGRVRFGATGPAASLPPAPPPGLPGLLCRHPMVLHYLRTGCRDPLSVTDVLERRDWHRTPVARVLRESLGVTDQLAIPLPSRPGQLRVWVAMRRTRPFDRRDLRTATGLQRLLLRLDAAAPRVPADALTASELDVLQLVAEGHTAAAIGRRLSISPRTVSKHLEHVYRKLGVSDRLSAVLAVSERGLPLSAEPHEERRSG